MIEMAKGSVAKEVKEDIERFEDGEESEEDAVREERTTVKSPSMMRMACNIMEVLRLREELIERIDETNILTKVYLEQGRLAGKGKTQVDHDTPIAFAVSSLLKDHVNIVDMNDGKNRNFKLPFMEFDEELKANLDLRSESCIKALMTDLGVEEMRAVLHYQVMQQQLLTVAVMNNQALIDGPQKGLVELELLQGKALSEAPISVPNSVIDVN